MLNQGRMESIQEQSDAGGVKPVELSEDLVCGLLVGPGSTVRHEGQDYYFCSPKCAEEFRSDPSTYLKPAGGEVSSARMEHATGEDDPESTVLDWTVVYTCPRHPEVELPGPGACPTCGNALEPRTLAFEDDQEDPEL